MKVLYCEENNNWLCLGTHRELHKLLLLDFSSKGIQDIFEEENIIVCDSGIHFYEYATEIGVVAMEYELNDFIIRPITAEELRVEIWGKEYINVTNNPAWVMLQNLLDRGE